MIHYDTNDAADIEPFLENSSVTEIPSTLDTSETMDHQETQDFPAETSKLLSLETESSESESGENEEEESKIKTKTKAKVKNVKEKEESSSDSSDSSDSSGSEHDKTSKTKAKVKKVAAKLETSDDSSDSSDSDSDDSVIEVEPVIHVSKTTPNKSWKSKENSPVPSTSGFSSKKSPQVLMTKAEKIKSDLGKKQKITPSRDRPMKAAKDFILIRDHTDSDASSTVSPRKKPKLASGKHEVVTVHSDADTLTTDNSESEQSEGSDSESVDDLTAMAEAAGLTMDALSEEALSEDSDDDRESDLMYLGTPDDDADKVFPKLYRQSPYLSHKYDFPRER